MNKVPTPFSSRADHVEHLARIMRDRAYPEFGAAPLPLWAMDAADIILHEFEDLYRASQGDEGWRAASRRLHACGDDEPYVDDAASQDDSLDVERLAVALFAAMGWPTRRVPASRGDEGGGVGPFPAGLQTGDPDNPAWTELAHAIAREYAALTEKIKGEKYGN